ncbi:MAG: ATP-binding protein [Enhygromyxa sp.]
MTGVYVVPSTSHALFTQKSGQKWLDFAPPRSGSATTPALERYHALAVVMRVGDYELREQIHASTLSVVHRARRVGDGREVFVKTPSRQAGAGDVVAQLRHELLVCRMFDDPSLTRAIELIESEGATALVLEGLPEGMTLSRRAAEARLTAREAVMVALGILDGLATLHGRNVVHKDVKPDNVLVTRDLSRVVLIDFGISAIVPRDSGSVAANARLEGTLWFMPPEQTGRINRPIDYRSDYYALGATLYWMLAGEPPFGALHEPEELVHAHIARAPRRLDELQAEGSSEAIAVPPALARIVAKLLSKAADERYQGAFGLRRDLRRCAEELAAGGWPDFAIAAVDPAEQLRLPHSLYGRAAQLEQLREAAAAANEDTQVVVLRGPPGSGKTSLASVLLGSLDAGRLVVTTGFVDGGAEALTCLGTLLRSLLLEQTDVAFSRGSELELRLRDALGPNTALLSELVPELEELLGPQPVVATVGPGQARDRFFDTLARLVGALLLPSRRYVVFVDDLQWIDEAGARTLEALCVAPQRGVLVLLALRDDVPLAPDHPAATMLSRIRARGRQPLELRLEPLSREDVAALVEETLGRAPGSAELAELLHQRTHGTPLFVAQLLHSFYVDGIIDIDRTSGSWQIDLDATQRSESRGDVVDYLIARFAELPEPTRRLLGIAACFGPSFDLVQLTEVAGEPVNQAVLEAAAAAYLLTVSAGRSHAVGRATTPGGSAIEYRFAHERLRQIALSAAPEDRAPLHLSIARSLCDSILSPEQLSRVAEHIGAAVELITDPGEREQFAAICETAGVLAKASATYAIAARQFETALRLMSEQPPSAQLSVALDLGECLYMSGRIEAADQVFTRARALIGDRAEHAQLLMVRERLALARDDRERALALVIEAAELFDLDLRRGGSQAWIDELLGGFMAEFDGITLERLSTLPKLEDPEWLHLLRLLSSATYPAYVDGDINLFMALLIAVIRGTLAHGLCDVAAQCLMQLGMAVAGKSRDYPTARRCAELGFATLERFPGSPIAGQVEHVYYGNLQPMFEPLSDGIAPMLEAHTKLRAAGALLAACYANAGRIVHELIIGAPLTQTLAGIEEAIGFASGLLERSQVELTSSYLGSARALAGAAPPSDPQAGAPDQQPVPQSPLEIFLAAAMQAYASLMLGDREATAAAIRRAEPLADVVTGQLAALWFEIVRALHGCEVIESLGAEQRAAHTRQVEALLEILGRWEESCPVNATALRCLVGGAWALARGQLDQAFEALTVAADAAAAAHFNNIEGLACELAGRALLRLGRRRHAVGYLGDALQAYGRWGSLPLQRRVRDALRERGLFALSSSGATSSLAHGGESGKLLDVASVIKMSQAILEATELEEVIGRLLAAVSENAGADRCVLLLDEDDGLRIRAERRATGELYLLDEGLRIASAEQLLAQSMVQIAGRAHEAVIVDDARRDPRCARDPYIRAEQVRALLLVPVFTGSRRVGILYLENHLTPGAFTTHHVLLATTLAAQAAASIANARLFDALREGEAQWRAVVDGAPDFILILDRRRRIEFANRLGYGLDAEQVIGKPAEELIALDDRPRMIAAVDFVFETGVGTSFESTLESPAGVRQFTTRVGPVVREGLVERVVMVSTDVTEQRRLEAELRHSQKMQAVGTLAGGIAHDFNNLLTVILGATDLCSMYAAGNQPLQAGLSEIEGAATRAASLTRQLLAFSRKQTLQPKRFDLAELVRELGSMLTRLLGEEVSLTPVLPEQPCPVYADPTQFSQVLVNLAVNARDAMPEGGSLRVTVAHDETGKVLLEVADDGVGMEAELVRHIFEPFFTTKTEGKGTGLGLSTVLGIVEQSGGQITVDSQPGQGTCFRIELPSADEAEGGPSSAAASLPRGTETILLVEDDLALQRLIARMLELQGYQVRIAANSEQAVAIASELPELHLLIIDLVMPGVRGPKVAGLVLREHPHAKVLYISGRAADQIFDAPVTNLLHEPFTRETMAARVRAILDDPSDRVPT